MREHESFTILKELEKGADNGDYIRVYKLNYDECYDVPVSIHKDKLLKIIVELANCLECKFKDIKVDDLYYDNELKQHSYTTKHCYEYTRYNKDNSTTIIDYTFELITIYEEVKKKESGNNEA